MSVGAGDGNLSWLVCLSNQQFALKQDMSPNCQIAIKSEDDHSQRDP